LAAQAEITAAVGQAAVAVVLEAALVEREKAA
jgi:hypothetical protein